METVAASWKWNRVARFGLSCLALFALYAVLPESFFGPLGRHTAAMAARLLAHSRFQPVLAGTTLSRDGFAVEVIPDCTVVPMAILFFSFVVAACMAWLQLSSPEATGGGMAIFVARFAAGSAIPFLLWLLFSGVYVRLTDNVVRGLFALWDVRLRIPYQHAIYYQTFNLVTLFGLFVADRGAGIRGRCGCSRRGWR